MSEYDIQATEFLEKCGFALSIRPGKNKEPLWNGPHGDHYRITVKRKADRKSLSYDFWDSMVNMQEGKQPSNYSVLACLSSESGMPTDPDEVIAQLGPMPIRQAIATAKFVKEIQSFFTEEELERLWEIS